MVEVSIICLIYKSTKLAQAVYESLYKHTPMLKDGRAELLFVANDPTEELVDFLKKNKYPYIINVNEQLDDKALFKLGFGAPEYMRRVYQGYNQGILNAHGQKVVLINSDNFFSKDWLENLLKYSDYKKVVCSTLVEPGSDDHGVFPFAIQQDFGKMVEVFDELGFQKYTMKIAKTGYTSGGAYMPCLIYRDVAIMAGLYPEGNLAGKSFGDIKRYGDEAFYDQLKAFGVEHLTAKDSIVYHLKEGESSSNDKPSRVITNKKYQRVGLNRAYSVKPVELIPYIVPESNHQDIINQLGKKISVFVINFVGRDDLYAQINQVSHISADHLDITVLYDKSNREFIDKTINGINYVFVKSSNKDSVLYDLLFKAYGEYILVTHSGYEYEKDLFSKIDNKDKIYYLGRQSATDGTLVDSIANFIIPKQIVLSQVGYFLGLFLSDIDVGIAESRCLSLYPALVVDAPSPPPASATPAFKQTMIYRAASKLYHDGPVEFTRAIINKLRNRSRK